VSDIVEPAPAMGRLDVFPEDAMATGPEMVGIMRRCGFTHVVWIPDSELGTWDAALSQAPDISLIRPTREGEAIAIAGGLYLGGAKPLIVMQCTGFFEAGDAFRNLVHDLQLPLIFVIGLRSYHAYRDGRSSDTCPKFTEPILKAWGLAHTILERDSTVDQIERHLRDCADRRTAGAVVLAE
jgi:sulfopyruvate decarboxylase subunit alpha